MAAWVEPGRLRTAGAVQSPHTDARKREKDLRNATVTGLIAALTAGTVVLVAAAQAVDTTGPSYWPRTTAVPVVKEWYSDVPWHQKLGTFAGNGIDVVLVLPYDALGDASKKYCKEKGHTDEECMLLLGINNILGTLRTDTPYVQLDPLITKAAECKDKTLPCIEVRLALSSFWTRVKNGVVVLEARKFGSERDPHTDDRYGGYVITDGSTYGPQMPWYMAHYCDSMFPAKDVQDPVCYGDYFSPMNNLFNPLPLAPGGAQGWPRAVPWSVYPAATTPNTPTNHCAADKTECTAVLAGFPFSELQSNPSLLQYKKYNDFLLTWFNRALDNFPKDAGIPEVQRHFPWSGKPVSWETFLYPQGALNPFLGQYPNTKPGTSDPSTCDMTVEGTGNPLCKNTGNQMASFYQYPRQCTLGDLANGNASRLRQCGLNYELHHNGYWEQWPQSFWPDIKSAGMVANQYGRTSFLFAGVPGMQMPVTFYKDPGSSLSIYEQVHNASIFSLYLPIANESDTKRAFPNRNYTDVEFYHTLLMSNHMESEPELFADGIRGKVLWHNEYRTQKMYTASIQGNQKFDARTFAAAFDPQTAPAPFHNHTCDGCHVRNGSGVPINTAGKLDNKLQKFMKDAVYNPYFERDYTFTGQIRPMKLIFLDLKRNTSGLDASRYSEPLAFPVNMKAQPMGTIQSQVLYYNNKIMNFYGDSFHVTAPGYSYGWSYEPADANRLVVNAPRFNRELGEPYLPQQVAVGGFQTPTSPPCDLAPPPTTSTPWPTNCGEINGAAIKGAIDGGEVGFMLLNGKRLGNLSAMEAIPNRAIVGFRDSQNEVLGQAIAGEIIWNAGSRGGIDGTVKKDCRTKSLTDCYIGRFGWLGDRASLEDQVANAAFVEMNLTTSKGYEKLYPNGGPMFPIRYAHPNCGPANQKCVGSKGNGDLSEKDVERMADYARWLGNPTRSEFQVALPEVVAGEKIFRNLKCDTCHVIRKIEITPEDTMLTKDYRDRLATRVKGSAVPFLSYLGTDLLMHDMGYLSQVAKATKAIRNNDGVVMPGFENYVQKIRTPALKGLRFNRFVTDSHRNTVDPTKDMPTVPACDFLLHDGRACDAIEAAFLHDGPAIKKLGVITGLNGAKGLNDLGSEELKALRAFLYSL